MSREEVLATFWPDEEPSVARRRLNQLVYSLKKRLEEPLPFDLTAKEIHQAPFLVTTDLQQLQRFLMEDGFPPPGTSPPERFLAKAEGLLSPELSDWIQGRDSTIRRGLRNHLRSALAKREELADWAGAEGVADFLLSLDPTNEEALRSVLSSRARRGGLTGVEPLLSEFSSKIQSLTGAPWTPQPDTEELIHRIRSGEAAFGPDWAFRSLPATPQPLLRGRKMELKLLQTTLQTPPDQVLRGILVIGEAGIGKTRLIKEALTGLSVTGATLLTAGSAELERIIPLNPLIEAFAKPQVGTILSQLEDPWRAVLYGVMPRHFTDPGPIPQAPQIQPGSIPRRLFEAFHQLLLSIVERGPAILVIEDIQWADETTLAVLDFLVRRWDQGRLQLLVSARSEEIRRRSTLKSFLDTLQVHDDFLEVPLRDLNQSASSELIRDLTDRPLPDSEVRYLQSLAGGNPFFLIELTLEYLAGRIDPPSEPRPILSIPLSIRQVLERRLSHLSSEADRLLGGLSVHIKPLGFRHLANLVSVASQECIAALDQLHEFRLISASSGKVSIGHELIRQTVYQGLSDSRRAWLHEQAARHLEENSDPLPDDELAVHFHAAGLGEEARRHARAAADHAEASGAVAEALKFLGIAREHAQDPEEVAELIARMGHLHYLHQNLEEAAPLLEIAAQRLRRQGHNARALSSELERVDALGQSGLLPLRECLEELARIKTEAKESEEWETYMRALDIEVHQRDRIGDLSGIRRILTDGENRLEHGGPKALCRAHALLALNIYFGDPHLALASARTAIGAAEGTGSNDLYLHALNRLIVSLHYQGLLNTTEGQAVLAEAEKRLNGCGDLLTKFNIRLNAAVWHLETMDFPRAQVAFEAASRTLRGTNARKAWAMLHLNLGELHLSSDDTARARLSYQAAEGHLSTASPDYFRAFLNAGLGLCALHDGDLQEARSREQELPSFPDFWTHDPTVFALFSARMRLRRGDLTGAITLLREIREKMRNRFLPAWFRLSIEECRVTRKADPAHAQELASGVLDLTERLGIPSLSLALRPFAVAT